MRRNLRGWLLWLALILPIAQAMAGVHALSHLTGERQDEGVAHLVHCELCLTAADLASGAPTAAPSLQVGGAAVDVLVAARLAPAVERLATWRPPARAPPAST